jgi:hypothetical protein
MISLLTISKCEGFLLPFSIKKFSTKIEEVIFSPQLHLSDKGDALLSHPTSQFLNYDASRN